MFCNICVKDISLFLLERNPTIRGILPGKTISSEHEGMQSFSD